jgi:hypothetical protein
LNRGFHKTTPQDFLSTHFPARHHAAPFILVKMRLALVVFAALLALLVTPNISLSGNAATCDAGLTRLNSNQDWDTKRGGWFYVHGSILSGDDAGL